MTRSDLEEAKTLLAKDICTCVLCREGKTLTSIERGVMPLLTWLDSGLELRGYAAADKVVGKAAAFLYVLLGVTAVYAPVMSQPAWETLEQHGIAASCDRLTEAIRNRSNTGFCPMETAVWAIDKPEKALFTIRQTLDRLNG